MKMANTAEETATLQVTGLEHVPKTLGKTKVTAGEYSRLVTQGKGYISAYDYVINPYAGCSFGCSYCYASNFRTSEVQKDTWGQWVEVKSNAVRQMGQVRKGSLNGRTIYMATVTDPYQPIERTALVTRQILEKLVENHPQAMLVLQTRGTLVERDTDLFHQLMEGGGKIQVNMTISTDDDEVRKIYEPGCSSVKARIKTVKTLNEAGIQTCVTMTPTLPMADPVGFVNELVANGTKRFILQPFRYQSEGYGSFIARTDKRGIESAKEHYGTTSDREAIRRYNADYLRSFRAIDRALMDHPEIYLGIDRDGFKPPFEEDEEDRARRLANSPSGQARFAI